MTSLKTDSQTNSLDFKWGLFNAKSYPKTRDSCSVLRTFAMALTVIMKIEMNTSQYNVWLLFFVCALATG